MKVKEAVQKAKEYITEMFENEDVRLIGLEEVVFDRQKGVWKVTIGFARTTGAMSAVFSNRVFKVVHIENSTGEVVSMTHRVLTTSD